MTSTLPSVDEQASEASTLHERAREAHARYRAVEASALEAEAALIRTCYAQIDTGDATWHDLLDLYDQTRTWAIPGWQLRFRDLTGMTHHEVRRLADQGPRPGGPAEYGSRSWTITRDTDETGYPPRGTYAVYTMWGCDGERKYVGTSFSVFQRIEQHTNKPWHELTVREAANKTGAEGLEALEILTHMPPWNDQLRKSGGPGVLRVALSRAGLLTPDLADLCKSLNKKLYDRVEVVW